MSTLADIGASYEAGYRNGSINYELEHCPVCKNVADLQAALDENAKLRELAKEATKVAHVLCGEYAAPCSSCAVDRCDTGCKLDWIDELAHELGIEVDG